MQGKWKLNLSNWNSKNQFFQKTKPKHILKDKGNICLKQFNNLTRINNDISSIYVDNYLQTKLRIKNENGTYFYDNKPINNSDFLFLKKHNLYYKRKHQNKFKNKNYIRQITKQIINNELFELENYMFENNYF